MFYNFMIVILVYFVNMYEKHVHVLVFTKIYFVQIILARLFMCKLAAN